MVESGKKNKAPALPPDVQSKIGEKLKALYDDVVRQPVPDRFRDLLSQLDAAHLGAAQVAEATNSLKAEAEGQGK
jgi:hypothetical protein